jgi:hypothetical protein
MPVQQVPGLFDYIGQGLSNVAGNIQNSRDTADAKSARDQEQARRDAQFLMTAVQSGAIDSDTANATDVAKGQGLHFQPSTAELRRKILANPTGMGGEPGGTPDASGIGQPYSAPTPWSPDQRSVAGLPSASALSGEALQGKVNDIKQRYLADPKSVSDSEAKVAGLPTASDTAISERTKLDPVIQTAASKYVSQTMNSTLSSGSLDPTTPQGLRQLRRQSSTISAGAYKQYMADAKASGDQVALDPKNQGYMKTFFDAEVEKQIKETTDTAIRMKSVTPQKTDMTPLDWSKQMREGADDADKTVSELQKNPLYLMAATSKDPSKLPPAAQQVMAQIHQKEMEAIAYRKAGRAFMSSKVDPAVIQRALTTELDGISGQSSAGGATAPVTPGASQRAGGAGTRVQPATGTDPAILKEMAARVSSGKATIADVRTAVAAGQITSQDFATVLSLSQTPKKP